MEKFIIGLSRGSRQKGAISIGREDRKEILGRWCLYENEFGLDLARIICLQADKECAADHGRFLGQFVRCIDNDDLEKIKRLKSFEKEAGTTCNELIEKHNLPMKVVRTSMSFDEKRLTFFFIADERVDFRALVKDLISRFHKMIRLQQIGPRDHARIVDGVGICGRGLCCASFLGETEKITKETAAAQGIEGLGSDKISGVCGKLMCCLRYELGEYNDNAKIKIQKSK